MYDWGRNYLRMEDEGWRLRRRFQFSAKIGTKFQRHKVPTPHAKMNLFFVP